MTIYTDEFAEATEEFAEAARKYLRYLEHATDEMSVSYSLSAATSWNGWVTVNRRCERLIRVKIRRRSTTQEKQPASVSLT